MAELDEQTQKVIEYLVQNQKLVGEAMAAGGPRPWQDFFEVFDVDRFNFEGMAQVFSREAANARYEALFVNDGLAKEVQALKHCADILAAFERDHRMRTRTRVRMFVHGASRNAGHGLPNGPLKRNSIGYVTRVLGEDKKQKEPAS